MKNEEKQLKKAVGEIRKRRETMADGKRYIIYYTFGKIEESPSETIAKSGATKTERKR